MGKLFEIEELDKQATATGHFAEAAAATGRSVLAMAESVETLRAVVGNVEPDQVIKFVTNGAWSMHDLLGYLLQKTGPARIYLSTWTITETPVRVLCNLKEQGLITELHCVLDYRTKDRTPKPFQLLSGVANRVKLTKCHAKVTVIENDAWGISIVGSANYSKNPRLEAGTIFTTKHDAVFDRAWLERTLDDNG